VKIGRVVLGGTLAAVVGLALLVTAQRGQTSRTSLDIYVVDTDGGKATLFVTPAGETVLIDTGNPGTRDADRIVAAAKAAGVTRIDTVVLSHYHADHVGGLAALAERMPIGRFVDHGATVEATEQVPGFMAAYERIRGRAPHTVVAPGDTLPLTDVEWRIVSSAGRTITAPLTGGGAANAACADFKRGAENADDENNQSVASVITYGRFRTVDLADLIPNREGDLMCPRNLIGPIDLYLVSHHGTEWSGTPALVHGLNARVAVMQNGATKGGVPSVQRILRTTPAIEDVWQLHWSFASGMEFNSPGLFIANMNDPAALARVVTSGPAAGRDAPDHQPAYWIKISAEATGDFTVTNSRNGFRRTYRK